MSFEYAQPLPRGTVLRQARARRVRSIRRRIAAGSLALFVAVWLLIAVVMATGHDPVLSRKSTTTVASTSAGTSASSGSSSGSSGSSSSGSSGSSSSGSSGSTTTSSSSGSGLSAATSSQS